MAAKVRFVSGTPRALGTGLLAAAAAGLLYFLSLCVVDRRLAAFARGCPDRAHGLDVTESLFCVHAPGGELLPGLVGLSAWRLR
ncbi:MAG: hypothetical protein JO069_07100 [Verrucomicrobia bacterium]|nr:hypothetical protein [Verrucomicrobiota bacterium]